MMLAINDEKSLEQRDIDQAMELAREQWGDGWEFSGTQIPVPKVETMVEVHSIDPWWIARYQPQMKRTAIDSLTREGFECWAPTYKSVRQMPLRMIPPKKRHMAKRFIMEKLVERFPGYVFIRRVKGHFDVNRLFDLKGCGAIVTIAGSPAKIEDFDVETMRLAEADGTFDAIELRSQNNGYRIERLSPEALQQWTGQSKLDGQLDDSGKRILSVQAFGRVERLIAAADLK